MLRRNQERIYCSRALIGHKWSIWTNYMWHLIGFTQVTKAYLQCLQYCLQLLGYIYSTTEMTSDIHECSKNNLLAIHLNNWALLMLIYMTYRIWDWNQSRLLKEKIWIRIWMYIVLYVSQDCAVHYNDHDNQFTWSCKSLWLFLKIYFEVLKVFWNSENLQFESVRMLVWKNADVDEKVLFN